MKIENRLIYVWKSLIHFKTSAFLEKAPSQHQELTLPTGNSSGNLSVNFHGETNPDSLLKPDLPSVSAMFCQRRSAVPSTAQTSDCIHQERHKGIYTMETPFCQFMLDVLDHCCIIQTHQHCCGKNNSAAHYTDHIGGQ